MLNCYTHAGVERKMRLVLQKQTAGCCCYMMLASGPSKASAERITRGQSGVQHWLCHSLTISLATWTVPKLRLPCSTEASVSPEPVHHLQIKPGSSSSDCAHMPTSIASIPQQVTAEELAGHTLLGSNHRPTSWTQVRCVLLHRLALLPDALHVLRLADPRSSEYVVVQHSLLLPPPPPHVTLQGLVSLHSPPASCFLPLPIPFIPCSASTRTCATDGLTLVLSPPTHALGPDVLLCWGRVHVPQCPPPPPPSSPQASLSPSPASC
jgi:hypothetical protein